MQPGNCMTWQRRLGLEDLEPQSRSTFSTSRTNGVGSKPGLQHLSSGLWETVQKRSPSSLPPTSLNIPPISP